MPGLLRYSRNSLVKGKGLHNSNIMCYKVNYRDKISIKVFDIVEVNKIQV